MPVLRDPQQLEAIDLGHADIADKHGHFFTRQEIERGLRIRHGLDREFRLERLLEDDAICSLVIDVQHKRCLGHVRHEAELPRNHTALVESANFQSALSSGYPSEPRGRPLFVGESRWAGRRCRICPSRWRTLAYVRAD
jgi:hypothetical protein